MLTRMISPLEGEMAGRPEGGRRRLLTLLAIAAAATLALPSAAFACSCMRQSVPDQARRATAIFVGIPVGTQSLGGDERVTTFRVLKNLKGSGRQVKVHHRRNDGGNCGIDFQPGRQLLITATRLEGKLRTNSCSMPQGSEAEFRAALSGKGADLRKK